MFSSDLTDNLELSEGEKFIEEYFLDEDIKYESQKKIYLKGDSKSFRVVDFYLPKFDVYVEFFGKWNESRDERNRYRDKKNIYFKNQVPCIYLYPENLGIIEHVFPLRIRKVLSQHGKRRHLLKYLSHDFHRHNVPVLGFFLIFTASVIVHFVRNQLFEDFLITVWFQMLFVITWYYIATYREYLKLRK